MTKLLKTYWIDRYDHILSLEEVEKADLMSIVDVKDSPVLQKKFVEEEEKLWAFVKAWLEGMKMREIRVFVEKGPLNYNVPISLGQQEFYDQLDRISMLAIAFNVQEMIRLEAIIKLGIREILKVTVQINDGLLKTGFDMALFIQKIEPPILNRLLDQTDVYCLNEFEEDSFWEEVEDILEDYQQRKTKIAGAVFGMAIGDGLGYPAEFLKRKEIQAKLLENGFLHPNDDFIEVTDDTQMALAVAKALYHCKDMESASLETSLRKYFVEWLNDPANNRAPGMTCLASCERLEKGLPWLEATDKSSKGCGANMRVLPVGFYNLTEEMIPEVAQFQAAITHGHPTALVASELTAITVYKLLHDTTPDQLLSDLLAYAEGQQANYYKDYLQQLWDRPPFRTPQEFIQLGWEECIEKLKAVQKGLSEVDESIDPCAIGGAGWTAEESFATALYCFLLNPEDPDKVLHNAICTSGDSDSIACLAGGFVGAYLGLEALPKDRVQNVEYQQELWEVVKWLA